MSQPQTALDIPREPGSEFLGAKAHAPSAATRRVKRLGQTLFGVGLFLLFLSATGIGNDRPLLFFALSIGLAAVGGLLSFLPQLWEGPPGIRNNHLFFRNLTSRGLLAWTAGLLITGFYVILYWFPQLLQNWVRLTDPLSLLISGKPADKWFLYGTFYTTAVLVMGVRMFIRYRHNRYQLVRTASVMFFQLGFAFLLPYTLKGLNEPDFYFTYFWPLKYNYLFPNDVHWLLSQPGGLGTFMVFWGAMMSFVATPVLTYFFGKRWYCSWVCGCGGLAETLGDPWRQLSLKSLRAWKVERVLIHSVLVFIVVTTGLLWLNSAWHGAVLGRLSNGFARAYGFYIGAIFSGVIGVGFYPLMGARVWCRFGCPLAAILGLLQKFFSRFRITTNGGQCISCGNCSTYCEMGIDVRWYAQRGQNIIRASCVGCGICSAVCPRGVLKLETGPRKGRYNVVLDDRLLDEINNVRG
ncbi:MAG: 4Fe-4S binding protein [Calditrichaeota bacterium]|nr:MAG: 4Fe-4S binding protein [Calditrichota bacterium]